jgi:hypothetical protein
VGKTDAELKARFSKEPNRQFSSSFKTEEVAEHAISKALAAERTRILGWLRGTRGKLELDIEAGGVIGRVAIKKTGMVENATMFRVVLVRDASMPDGYRILTSFPKP